MDNKSREKYTEILNNGKKLIEQVTEIENLISNDDNFRKLRDQNGHDIVTNKGFCNMNYGGKAVAKIIKVNDYSSFLYWCPCNFLNFFSIAGAYNYNEETKVFDKISYIPRDEQTSYFGKDIKMAANAADYSNHPIAKKFIEKYITNDHPIADNIFYTIYFVEDDDCNQELLCCRNTKLSPRPETNKDTTSVKFSNPTAGNTSTVSTS